MEWAALIISICALTLSVWAVIRGGAIDRMKKEVESLSFPGESLRQKTADLLDRVEKRVRGEQKPGAGEEKESRPIKWEA